jgi:hypothetical protein
MNAPFTPVDSHTFDDAFRLLAIAADLSATRQRLDELKAAEASAKERIAELHAMEAEIPRLHSTAVATNIVADRRVAAVEAREAEADERDANLNQLEARQSLASIQRERTVVEAGALANKREAERLAAMRKDYEADLKKLKGFTATLR